MYQRAMLSRWKTAVSEDDNVQHLRHLVRARKRSARSDVSRYLAQKIPIVQWLPSYSPSWVVNDLIAGLTIGVLLVPQSLAYASIANIPGGYGLISSWMPTLIYTVMGTSKGPVFLLSNLNEGKC
jgi:sodium-independent sulfate anion transporter 11